MIILFTLTSLTAALEFNQPINPFMEVGEIHKDGLDAIITDIGTDTVNELAANYIVTNYGTNLTFAKQSILPITTKGYNVAINAQNNLLGVDLNGGYNMYVQKVFSFIDSFPPSIAANTMEQSFVIFGDNNSETFDIYQSQFLIRYNNLLNEIMDSGLPEEQKVLPLVGMAVLLNSYFYWQKAFFNTGGSNAWHTFIVAAIADVKDINWRQVIQQDIKGAMIGAVAGGKTNPTNLNGGIVIGAAAAGMAASAQDVVLQANFISVYDPA